MTTSDAVPPGFADPVHDAQRNFRRVLTACSRPGTVVSLDPPPTPPAVLPGALAAFALTLFAPETPVWLDPTLDRAPVRDYLAFHVGTGCVAEPAKAAFALIGAAAEMPRLDRFCRGTHLDPERSATLLVRLPALAGGPQVTLHGPGIETEATIAPQGLPGWFWTDWTANGALYPTGVDIFLTDGSALVGLPRTTKGSP